MGQVHPYVVRGQLRRGGLGRGDHPVRRQCERRQRRRAHEVPGHRRRARWRRELEAGGLFPHYQLSVSESTRLEMHGSCDWRGSLIQEAEAILTQQELYTKYYWLAVPGGGRPYHDQRTKGPKDQRLIFHSSTHQKVYVLVFS